MTLKDRIQEDQEILARRILTTQEQALAIIILTLHIRRYLEACDQAALNQARNALNLPYQGFDDVKIDP